MRRENRRKSLEEGLTTKKMLYIMGSILSLAIIAFVITYFVYGNQLSKTQKLGNLNSITQITTEEASASHGKNVNEMQNEISNNTQINSEANDTKVAINTNNTENKNEQSSNNTQNTANNNEVTKKPVTKVEKVADPKFKMPVSGEILKEFANNKLVYSSTLDVWTTHNGIDIKADKTTVVKASAEGTVSSIKNDPRYGLTVIIEHVNGYKTIYSNLLTTEFVVEGEKVKQGQSLGTVGNTAAFEISEEPHLHFELLKNNEQQDPELYLAK